jgi:DNA polymerase-3 subunit beta
VDVVLSDDLTVTPQGDTLLPDGSYLYQRVSLPYQSKEKTMSTKRTMRFSMTANELSQALQGVGSAVDTYSDLGGHLLITSNWDPGGVAFAGLNHLFSIIRWADLETKGASLGQALDARAFTEMVGTLPAAELVNVRVEEEIEESTDNESDPAVKRLNTHLSCEAIDVTFLGLDEETFPDLEERPENGVRLKAGNLYRALKKVAFAKANREVTHEVLQGVHAEFAENSLTVVTADGYRMARQVMTLELEAVTEPFSVTIPGPSVDEMLKVLKRVPETASVLFKANKRGTSAQLLCGNALLTTKLYYEVRFPDYQRIIPDMHTYTTRVTVDRNVLRKACERARIFSRDTIYFHIDPGTLTITATADSGLLLNEGQTALSAKVTNTEVKKIAFNPRYIIEVLKALESDQVTLAFSDSNRPGVVYGAGEADAWRDYIYVIMPMLATD